MKELWSGHGWAVKLETAKSPEGVEKTMARVYRCDSVHILASLSKGKVLLLREYRAHYGEYLWMLPSGKVDKELDIQHAAQRELQEETGYRAEKLDHWFTTHAFESVAIAQHVFRAKDLIPDPLAQDEHEMIEVHELELEDAINKVLSSPIVHTVSAMALFRYKWERC